MIGLLLTLLILLLIGAVILWLLQRFVLPILPADAQRFFMAIVGLIAIVILLYLILPAPYGSNFRLVP